MVASRMKRKSDAQTVTPCVCMRMYMCVCVCVGGRSATAMRNPIASRAMALPRTSPVAAPSAAAGWGTVKKIMGAGPGHRAPEPCARARPLGGGRGRPCAWGVRAPARSAPTRTDPRCWSAEAARSACASVQSAGACACACQSVCARVDDRWLLGWLAAPGSRVADACTTPCHLKKTAQRLALTSWRSKQRGSTPPGALRQPPNL